MQQRWVELWNELGFSDTAKQRFTELANRYSEPHRFYHTMAHIEHCLEEFAAVQGLVESKYTVELALWYHDIIYDTHKDDNESESAVFFSISNRLFFHQGLAQRVRNMILASKHTGPSPDPDTQIFLDIDLSILGQRPLFFDRYEMNIRKEYRWVAREVFAKKRSEILQGFLKRPSIYQSEFFRKKYEDQARDNLQRSIAQLSSRHLL